MMVLLPLVVIALVVVVLELRARAAGEAGTLLADPLPWTRSSVVRVPDRARAVLALAVAESRRIVVHPAVVVGLLVAALSIGLLRGEDGFDRYISITGGGAIGMLLPSVVFFSANLTASRARRSRAGDLLDATPATPAERTLALVLAALGPALLAAAIVAAGLAYYSLTTPELPATPPPAQLVALPLTVLGAGTLGVMAARWLPFRGGSFAVFVGIVGASVALSGDYPMLMTLTEFPEWTPEETYVLVDVPAAGAHAAYLLGLDVMAAIGALLVYREHRWRLLAAGAVATGATAWAAVLAT